MNFLQLQDVVECNPKIGTLEFLPKTPVSFVPMAAVSSESRSVTVPEIRCYEEVSKGYTFFRENDILLAKITPCFENGKMALAEGLPYPVAFGSTEFHIFRASDRIDKTYLFYLLQAPSVRTNGAARMKGAAGQKRVPIEYFKKLTIPLPPLPEQKRIAAILDAAEALRAKRRQTLKELDTFLQATFLHMFGDPVTNPKNFPVRRLKDFYVNNAEGTKCGPFGSALKKDEFVKSGIPVWSMDNIDISGRMVLPFRNWVDEDKFRELKSYSVHGGDVIISRAGTVGKMCVADVEHARSIISTNLIRLRLGPGLLPIYFVSLMTYFKGRVGRLKTGADGSFTHMNTTVLDKLSFPYPPLALQQQFAAIVESVERQKVAMKAHLAELDDLFGCLQQRAFNGEL